MSGEMNRQKESKFHYSPLSAPRDSIFEGLIHILARLRISEIPNSNLSEMQQIHIHVGKDNIAEVLALLKNQPVHLHVDDNDTSTPRSVAAPRQQSGQIDQEIRTVIDSEAEKKDYYEQMASSPSPVVSAQAAAFLPAPHPSQYKQQKLHSPSQPLAEATDSAVVKSPSPDQQQQQQQREAFLKQMNLMQMQQQVLLSQKLVAEEQLRRARVPPPPPSSSHQARSSFGPTYPSLLQAHQQTRESQSTIASPPLSHRHQQATAQMLYAHTSPPHQQQQQQQQPQYSPTQQRALGVPAVPSSHARVSGPVPIKLSLGQSMQQQHQQYQQQQQHQQHSGQYRYPYSPPTKPQQSHSYQQPSTTSPSHTEYYQPRVNQQTAESLYPSTQQFPYYQQAQQQQAYRSEPPTRDTESGYRQRSPLQQQQQGYRYQGQVQDPQPNPFAPPLRGENPLRSSAVHGGGNSEENDVAVSGREVSAEELEAQLSADMARALEEEEHNQDLQFVPVASPPQPPLQPMSPSRWPDSDQFASQQLTQAVLDAKYDAAMREDALIAQQQRQPTSARR